MMAPVRPAPQPRDSGRAAASWKVQLPRWPPHTRATAASRPGLLCSTAPSPASHSAPAPPRTGVKAAACQQRKFHKNVLDGCFDCPKYGKDLTK